MRRSALGLAGVAPYLPAGWALALGSTVGSWAGWAAPGLRRRAEMRVVARLGLGPAQAREVVDGMFRNLGRSVVEMARLARSFDPAHVELSAEDAEELARRSRAGLVVVTGHLGNWELLAVRLASVLGPSVVVARGLSDPRLGRWWADVRAANGVQTADRGDRVSLRRAIASGSPLGFVVDQRTDVRSVDLPFLGRAAPTPLGPARVSLRHGWPLVVAGIRRHADRHSIRLRWWEGDAIRPEAIMAWCNDILGGWIRESPDEWVWIHDRWGDE